MKTVGMIKKKWHLFALVVLGLTPILWFVNQKSGVLINGIDTNFPLDPLTWFNRRFYVWNNLTNAGLDFSSSVAGIFFHLIQVIPYILGFKLQGVQVISLIFWFGLIIFSSYIFAKEVFPNNKLARIIFVVFYSFNTYIFNTWENVKVANLSLVAGIPLGLTLLLSLNRKRLNYKKAFFYSSLIGIAISGAGINPSYFICLLFAFFIFQFSFIFSKFSFKNTLDLIKNFAVLVLPILLINMHWILPTVNFVIKNVSVQDSITEIGFTNWIDSLSENTSLMNVLRLQGAWDWYSIEGITKIPLHIPYALNYFYKFPFIVFSYTIPFFAILAFIVINKKDKERFPVYISFALMLLLGVFLGAGTHEPTGKLFRLLINKVPLFSLFRSPWYIFTPLVVISYAGLVSHLYENLSERVKKINYLKIAINFFFIVFLIGNLVYCYPLVTGKIFRPGRKDGFYIEFPDYVFEAGKWLGETEGGRIVGYPDDEIENFDWGYRGIESILLLIQDKEIIFSPLNLTDSPAAKLIKNFYLSLKKNQLDIAENIASKLNIDIVFEKNDQSTLAFDLPEQIRNNKIISFGEWSFYKFPSNTLAKIFSPERLMYGDPDTFSSEIIGTLDTREHLVNPNDTVVEKIDDITKIAGKVVFAQNSITDRFYEFGDPNIHLKRKLKQMDPSIVKYSFYIPEDGLYNPLLENYDLVSFGINNNAVEILLDGKHQMFISAEIGGSYTTYDAIYLTRGDHYVEIHLNNKNLVENGSFNESRFFEKGGEWSEDSVYEIISENKQKYISIINKGEKDISIDFLVNDFNPNFLYHVTFKYQQIYGKNGLALGNQDIERNIIKTQTERLPNYPEWHDFNFIFEPVKTDSRFNIILSAPFTTDPFGTKINYDELSVKKLFTNNLFFSKEGEKRMSVPEISFKKNSPVLYEVNVKNGQKPHILVFSENYSDEWKIKVYHKNGRKIDFMPPHFSINLYANAWYFEDFPDEYRAEIYYAPQRLLNMGVIVGLISFTLGLTLFLREKVGKKKVGRKKNV